LVDGGQGLDGGESVESGLIGIEGGISCEEPMSDVAVVEGAGEFDKGVIAVSFALVVFDSLPTSAGVAGRDEDGAFNFRSETFFELRRLSFVDDDPECARFRGSRAGPVRRVCLGGTEFVAIVLDIVFELDPAEEGPTPDPF